jgi:hypothetical protein
MRGLKSCKVKENQDNVCIKMNEILNMPRPVLKKNMSLPLGVKFVPPGPG